MFLFVGYSQMACLFLWIIRQFSVLVMAMVRLFAREEIMLGTIWVAHVVQALH
jgi:hypothetical protein